MRVLITGMTPTQCGSPGRFKWLVVPALFAAALRRAGHQVEHRLPAPNEDLTPYDVILMGLVPPGSIAARHVYVAMDVIYRAKASGAALLFYVDDWQFDKIMSGCRNKHRQPHGLYTTIKGRTYREWGETEEGRSRVALSMQALATRPWPVTLAVAFPWGDHTKLDKLPAKKTVYLDPSPLCWSTISQMHDRVTPAEDRTRRWVLASLSNHQQWVRDQSLQWPVEFIGPKQTGATYTLKEHEIVQLVAQSWGTICPPYHHAGSGWWRPRYLYTASTGAVAMPAREDATYLGETYQIPAHAIEEMNWKDLRELGLAQLEAFTELTWTTDQFVGTLEATLMENLLGPVKEQKSPVARWVDVREHGSALSQALDADDERDRTRRDLLAKLTDEAVGAGTYGEPYDETGTTDEVQPVHREDKRREERRFDRTHLRANKHSTRVHRDYAAHFFRWGWATRLIKPTDRVLDIGCGSDLALPYVLAMGGRYVPERYVGVDLNKLDGGPGWADLRGEFNIIDRWQELLDVVDVETNEPVRYTKIVCFEVIEHMTKTDGLELLRIVNKLLEPDGTLLISTPCFNGKAAVNHVHEWTIPELGEALVLAGLEVQERYGTFASYQDIKRVASPEHLSVLEELRTYYSDEVTACFLAPLYPNESRNNAWLCTRSAIVDNEEGTEE